MNSLHELNDTARPSGKPIMESRLQMDPVALLIEGFSIEVVPRTAAKIPDFRDILPAGTNVYVANVEGTLFSDMLSTARRIRGEGFPVFPHYTARTIRNRQELARQVMRYREEADVRQALLLAGGARRLYGEFDRSMQLLKTGIFDKAGVTDIHIAGHPEGNSDIDPKGGTANADAALWQKQAYAEMTDANMAIVTQFAFDARPVAGWIGRLAEEGISLPVHVGVAGPARLQTLIKFALECGIGPSLRVLQRRAKDLSKLLQPMEPTEFLSDLARQKGNDPTLNIEKIHFFPLGGIKNCAKWTNRHGAVPVNEHQGAT